MASGAAERGDGLGDAGRWRLWIDTGGTFTDCLALDPSGQLRRAKVLSSGTLRATVRGVGCPTRLEIAQNWAGLPAAICGLRVRSLGVISYDEAPTVVDFAPGRGELTLSRPLEGAKELERIELSGDEEAPVLAARLVTGTPLGAALPPLSLRLATTRGTNALLERRGAEVAFFVTRGFGDLLAIRDQRRPELFALEIERPASLASAVVEVDERRDKNGEVLSPLDSAALTQQAEALFARGLRVAAVAFVNAYADASHERAAAAILREVGFSVVRCSTELSPAIGLLLRAETAIIDAYLAPIIQRFIGAVDAALPAERRFLVMTSAGGLVRAEAFCARDSLLSGPAGGVVGAAAAARACGYERLLAFDMGGTSTDVSRYDGHLDYCFEQRVGDARLATTALAIESVAAGGGSICRVVDGRLAVGPESAGADPGPACYGAGGPLTLTDVDLLLGRVDPARFALPVRRKPAEAALALLLAELEEQTGEQPERDALLEGLVALADERMAEAIRGVSLRRGYEPADHTLVAFGGAGPQHACGVAERLGVETVIVPPDAGLLSARGLAHARLERAVEDHLLAPLDACEARLPERLAAARERARERVCAEGARAEHVVVREIFSLRFCGQDSTLEIEPGPLSELRAAFSRRYRTLYGHQPADRPLELVSLRVIASAETDSAETDSDRAAFDPVAEAAQTDPAPEAVQTLRMRVGGRWRAVPCYDKGALTPGSTLASPAAVIDAYSTAIIAPGWSAAVHESGALLLRRSASASGKSARRPEADAEPRAVQLELFAHRLTVIAEQMGEMLRRTALSTNIKERLDFSCALLDPEGQLVVNAPHIPVHLGSIGLCVRRVCEQISLAPGDVVVTNHPAIGGSHLPDVTIIAAVHDAAGALLGYVANRAHHAEIGGIRPGSMPPDARSLAEEGVVIAPRYLLRGGEARFDELRTLLSAAPYPSRSVEQNIADLEAQVAAAHLGRRTLAELAEQIGSADVVQTMRRLRALAASQARCALARLDDRVVHHVDALDDGSRLSVRLSLRGERAHFDFSGCAGVHPGSFNATPAIVRSAVLYVLRLLIDRPLPLNEGLLEPVRITLARGLLDPPFADDPAACPAVVAGNVETSQRLVDCLLFALGLQANSQGTMNNLLFGDEHFGYYETICGGTGAGPGFGGASAVHSHMTNTKSTDVELLEHRYPVRLERFAVRRGSGGAGRFPGGDGAIRELSFLAPLSVSLLGQHRNAGPRGLAGGSAGAAARIVLHRADGREQQLSATCGLDVAPGDRLVLETPGGGGYGENSKEEALSCSGSVSRSGSALSGRAGLC